MLGSVLSENQAGRLCKVLCIAASASQAVSMRRDGAFQRSAPGGGAVECPICDVGAVDPVAGGAELWGRKRRNKTINFLRSPFIILLYGIPCLRSRPWEHLVPGCQDAKEMKCNRALDCLSKEHRESAEAECIVTTMYHSNAEDSVPRQLDSERTISYAHMTTIGRSSGVQHAVFTFPNGPPMLSRYSNHRVT